MYAIYRHHIIFYKSVYIDTSMGQNIPPEGVEKKLSLAMSCPECKSEKIVKAGKTIKACEVVQRYKCQSCGHHFT